MTDEAKAVDCSQCKGSGKVPEYDMVGYFGDETCGKCKGTGKNQEIKPVTRGYATYES